MAITAASMQTAMAASLVELLVEPDSPTQYDRVNVFLKPLETFTANITVSDMNMSLANVSLVQEDEHAVITNLFLKKGTYSVRVTDAADASRNQTERFSVAEPAATSGECGNRVCELFENYKNCYNDCMGLQSVDGNICYNLTGSKIYFHFGNLFNDTNYTLSDDIERLGSEAEYDPQTKVYCVKKDSGPLQQDDRFYFSSNGRNWNVYVYGERTIAEDECKTAADCDDKDECTLDYCTGTPRECSHRRTQCGTCGDSRCSASENQTGCPKDCGCPAGKMLKDNSCIESITCQEGFYAVDNVCIPRCGDFKCVSGEDSGNCCADCGCSQGMTCMNSACIRQESITIPAVTAGTKTNFALIFSVLGLIVVISLGILAAVRHARKNNVPELGDYIKSMRMQGYNDDQIKEQIARVYGNDAAEKIMKNSSM